MPREIERQGASFHEILLDGLESMEGRLTLDIENIQANGKDVSLIGSHAAFVGDQLKITMDSETKPEIGKETFLVRASKLYLFDAVTEERIRFYMERKNNWKGWLYLAPALILITLFTLFPIVNTFIISFLKDYSYATGANDGFTFDNYGIVLGLTERIEGDPNSVMTEFIRYALPNTLLITFVTVPISVVIALLIAIGLNRIKAVRSFFQTIFFLPYVTNTIAIGMVFALIFSNTGIFNSLFGLENVNWIGVVGTTWGKSMFVICLYVIWTALPFKILIFASGLQSVDQQYYDAARIDSTPKWKTDLKIVLPLISPQLLYVSITSFISEMA